MSLMLGGDMPADLLAGGREPPGRPGAPTEVARFYNRTVRDNEATAREGRPVHKSVPYLEVRVPGDKTNVVDRPVRDADKERFPHAWAAYLNGDKEQVVGMPLHLWPAISEPRAEDLKAMRIRTVEELASVSDGNLKALGPDGRQLRDAAVAWLEAFKGLAPLSRLQDELAKRDQELATLKTQMAELNKALDRAGKGK